MRRAAIRISPAASRRRPLTLLLLIVMFLLAFGVVADSVIIGFTNAFDTQVVLAFRAADNPSNPVGPVWLQSMARDITALGSVVVVSIILLAVVAYLLCVGRRMSAWLMLTAVFGGMVLNSLLKLGFARPRPDLFIQSAKLLTASFPSGHAALSAITYLTIAALLTTTTASRRLAAFFIAVAILLTVTIGISRVYLGMHYPTDVLAGWCVGSAWALGCSAIFSLIQPISGAKSSDQ